MKKIVLLALLGEIKASKFLSFDDEMTTEFDADANTQRAPDFGEQYRINQLTQNIVDTPREVPAASSAQVYNYDDDRSQNEGDDANVQLQFRPDPAQAPWAAAPGKPTPSFFGLPDDGSDYYTRTVPSQYDNDQYMKSVITNYSIEGKNDDGTPNGKFWLNRSAMNDLATEIITTHLGAAHVPEYLGKVQGIWDHYDVLKEGMIPVEKASQFGRALLGEVEVNNGLQLQLKESGAIKDFSDDGEENMVQFRPNPVQQPWSAKPNPADKTPITGAFTVGDHDTHFYDRVVPEKFANGEDDLLMRSVIQNYALEGKGDDGLPTGQFYMNRDNFQALSNDVIQQHLGSKHAEAYREKIQTVWDHFDVNKKGYLLATEMPQCMRMLVGQVDLNNALQVQLDSQVDFRPDPVTQPWATKLAKIDRANHEAPDHHEFVGLAAENYAEDKLLAQLQVNLNSAQKSEAKGDADAAVAKTAAIKNIQKALTARILKRLDDGQPLVEVARKMKAIEGMQPQINDMERRLGIMQSVEPVLENAIKTLQKVVDVRGMGKK